MSEKIINRKKGKVKTSSDNCTIYILFFKRHLHCLDEFLFFILLKNVKVIYNDTYKELTFNNVPLKQRRESTNIGDTVMGMAASQARYLALVARKSNCEYEGQQINQARTLLSNQSANLFNQMLGLQVPVPPSTQDYTKQQYSFTDGTNDYTIDSWQQLATPEEDYNYVVTYHYYEDVYTGSQKKKNDPKVQFESGTNASVDQIETALRLVTQTKKEYEDAKAATKAKQDEAAVLSSYADNDSFTGVSSCEYNIDNDVYSVTQTIVDRTPDGNPIYKDSAGTQYYLKDGKYYNVADDQEYTGATSDLSPSSTTKGPTDFKGYSKLSTTEQETVKAAIDKLVSEGALSEDVQTDYANIYYDTTSGAIALKSDLRNLYGGSSGGSQTVLPVYQTTGNNSVTQLAGQYDAQISALQAVEFQALQTYQEAEKAYEGLQRPTYVGNCELTLLTDLTDDQKAELKQIVADMREEGIDSPIIDCFNQDDEYLGGIYQFKMNGVTYYTTFDDLYKSYESGTGINKIDSQDRLSYYNATYVSTKKEETQKALLETDGNGRFTTVRFENDSITYTLNVETVTDEDAYKDAMNQYNYENAIYDKMVQDINAKTSLIQQEDQQLELRLKQLDTEQNALSTEIDAVSKVVKDNIEDSFKTFGG